MSWCWQINTMRGHQVDDPPHYFVIDDPPPANGDVGAILPMNVAKSLVANPSYIVGMFFTSFFPDSEIDRVIELGIDIEQRQFRLTPKRIAFRQFVEDGCSVYHS